MMRNAVLLRVLVGSWLAWLLAMSPLALIPVILMPHRRIKGQTAQLLGKSGCILSTVFAIGRAPVLNGHKEPYTVGQWFRAGKIVGAYDNRDVTYAQQRIAGSTTFMPFAYPSPLTAAALTAMVLRRPQRMRVVPETLGGVDPRAVP